MKKWMWLIPFGIILVVIVGWLGWMYMDSTSESDKPGETRKASTAAEQNDEEEEEVVNTPVADSVVTFTSDDVPFKNGHDFISELHDFYNNTLGWGRHKSANYDRQVEKAEIIIAAIENAEVNNKEIEKDFESILHYANTVVEKDDRNAMLQLHRHFHDLDIYFNGYSYHEIFGVTDFKGQ